MRADYHVVVSDLSPSRRVGPKTKADIDSEIIALLEQGVMQSATHIEQMVLDMSALFSRAFPGILIDPDQVNATPFVSRMRLFGQLISEWIPDIERDPVNRMWISDTVRGWCAMATAENPDADFRDIVAALLRYADDPHFAVREWAWLALRPRVIESPLVALDSLRGLLLLQSGRVRRFAIESTRPRSVWGGHIQALKAAPEIGERFLRLVKCDPDRYVQDAVANWINDAAASRPDWVRSLAESWLSECSCPRTERIVRRGMRSIKAL